MYCNGEQVMIFLSSVGLFDAHARLKQYDRIGRRTQGSMCGF
jgi:hypothetical protein